MQELEGWVREVDIWIVDTEVGIVLRLKGRMRVRRRTRVSAAASGGEARAVVSVHGIERYGTVRTGFQP